jgi:hypothetical protein
MHSITIIRISDTAGHKITGQDTGLNEKVLGKPLKGGSREERGAVAETENFFAVRPVVENMLPWVELSLLLIFPAITKKFINMMAIYEKFNV